MQQRTRDFMEWVIYPSLDYLDLPNKEQACMLLLGTALQESKLKAVEQVGGPALGYFQMEPNTHSDLWGYLAGLPRARESILRLIGIDPLRQLVPDPVFLKINPLYAAMMARVFYWRKAEPLPSADDILGQARYYKRHWNTVAGKATEYEYVSNWHTYHG